MMKPRILALGALSILSATSMQASATTIYNSFSGPAGTYTDGPMVDTVYTVAQEFDAGTASFNTLQLALTATTPGDGRSATVYLLPNSNVNFGASATNAFNFTGLTALATISDSSLTATGATGPTLSQLTKLSISPSSIPVSSDGEFWVVVASATSVSSMSSFEWWDGNNGGTGTSGQLSANDGGGGWSLFDTSTAGGDQYGLIVSEVPEPATIALFGFGLVGLGYFRRRESV